MIPLKNSADLEKMREGGKILAGVFSKAEKILTAGVNAKEIDDWVRNAIRNAGAEPSFLGYRGYKYSSCVSKNEEVVHGIPHENKVFGVGDICSLDIGVYFKKFHVDAARTFKIGGVEPEVDKLVRVTEESFFKGIEMAVPGNYLGDISFAIQSHVELNGFSVVRDLFSHGVGAELHEDPLIPNFGKPKTGPLLKKGMTFAIEPMVNMGKYNVLTLPDKWTIITSDKKFSAHYENTIYIGETGPEILTLS